MPREHYINHEWQRVAYSCASHLLISQTHWWRPDSGPRNSGGGLSPLGSYCHCRTTSLAFFPRRWYVLSTFTIAPPTSFTSVNVAARPLLHSAFSTNVSSCSRLLPQSRHRLQPHVDQPFSSAPTTSTMLQSLTSSSYSFCAPSSFGWCLRPTIFILTAALVVEGG